MNYQGRILPFLKYLFIAFCLFLLLPPHFYSRPGHGVDPSWCIAIHLAHKYNLIFGKDFVFTYGPLTVLTTRLPIAVSRVVYIVADIYFLFTVAFVLKEILKKSFHYALVIFIFLAITINEYESLDIWYFFFFLFFLFSFLREPMRLSFIIQAALLSLVCFYFKVSFGIIAIFMFGLVITYMVIRKRLPLKMFLAIFLTCLAALWLSSLALHVQLSGYIKGSLQLINDYNDSMFTPMFGKYTELLYAGLVIIGLIASWMVYRLLITLRRGELLKNLDELLILALVALGIFIAFKGAFVRADGHITIFFKAISVLVTLLYLFAPAAKRMAALCCWLVLAIAFWAVNAIPGSYKPYRRVINGSFLVMNMQECKNYFREMKSYNSALKVSDSLGSSNNPFRQLIGDHTVDVMPAEISLVYFNGLRYNPRPVIQSYAAYNAYLDSLNYEKYTSATAPDYILYDITSIDDRYAYFDDSRTQRAILDRYTLAGELGDYLLLKKRAHPAGLEIAGDTEVIKAKLGEDIPVRKGQALQYTRILTDYDLKGRLKRLFYKPPALRIVFTLESGETVAYKAVKSIIASGVLVNKYVDTREEFPFLLLSGGVLTTHVKKIRFEAQPANGGFKKDITLINTYYSLPPKQGPEHSSDSTMLANLLNKYDRLKPEAVRNSFPAPEPFECRIENVKNHFRLITISGWAFTKKSHPKGTVIKAVLRAKDSLYELPTTNYDRGDLKSYFNWPDMPNAGFTSTISRVNLQPGEYQVGVLIRDTAAHKEWVNYTDRKIIIKRPFTVAISQRNPPTPADRNISYNIETIDPQGDAVTIRGWSFVKSNKIQPTSTWLLLQGKQAVYRIPTEATTRTDVAASFRDPSLQYCGFMVQVPRDSLPAETFDIGLEERYDNGAYCCTVWSEKKLKNKKDIVIPVAMNGLPPTGDFPGNVEAVSGGGGVMSIDGWALDKTDNVRNTIIKIVLRNNDRLFTAEVEPVPRPDVEQYLKKKFDSDSCGFHLKISTAALPKGKYRLGIHVLTRGTAGMVKFTDKYVEK